MNELVFVCIVFAMLRDSRQFENYRMIVLPYFTKQQMNFCYVEYFSGKSLCDTSDCAVNDS